MKKLLFALFLCAAAGLPAQDLFSAMTIHGKMPSTNSNKLYRLQAGSFTNNKNFIESFNLLRKNGFRPVYENYQNYRRLLITKVKADDVRVAAYRLGQLGFKELIITEETAVPPPRTRTQAAPQRQVKTPAVPQRQPYAEHESTIYVFEDK
ncbi:hypothetical protein FACS1894190_13540 [Spirochaetia bacterium]|nr:hypothetical protein FACS1894190_13540 [Spirochaetia bacterium]